MKVAEVYTTFMGECNPYGIGAPAIFLRLSGCPIRCYLKTLGTLCDTPLYLEKESGIDRPIDFLDGLDPKWGGTASIYEIVAAKRLESGANLICLTGGDPLWRKEEDLHKLFKALSGFKVCVETSGVISPEPYLKYDNVSFILDYKLLSAGVTGNKHGAFMHLLRPQDYIKFVVFNEADYTEMKEVLATPEFKTSKAKISAGVYWGGEINTFDLFYKMEKDALLGHVSLNMQAHKLAIAADVTKTIPEGI